MERTSPRMVPVSTRAPGALETEVRLVVVPICCLPGSVTPNRQPGLSPAPPARETSTSPGSASRRVLSVELRARKTFPVPQSSEVVTTAGNSTCVPKPSLLSRACKRSPGPQEGCGQPGHGRAAEGCGGSGAGEGWSGGFSPVGAVHRCKCGFLLILIFISS